MYIVAGLGNPGLAYRKSRHNAGFHALDALSKRLSIRVWKRGFSGIYGEGKVNGERVVLVKPQTYMNLSGDCLQKLMHFYKARPEDVIVMYDDIDLPLGSLRIRLNGSAGTHNGMRSVLSCLNSQNVPRVRIGVGRNTGEDLKDYVLKKPTAEEQKAILEAASQAAEAVEMILMGQAAEAQGRFNKKHEGKKA
ncbi:MAG: aminoacyl-tRNA hydrolase [Clostridia bacterium]|nr:aminoacyl-tRNA hydrolase [Clostridia bacterium]